MRDVAIPDIGDAEDVEVIEICVAPGEVVAENDALIVIESDKASMEVPAPFGGAIAEVLVALGDRVNAGDPVVRVEGEAAQDAAQEAAQGATPAAAPAEAESPAAEPATATGEGAAATAPATTAPVETAAERLPTPAKPEAVARGDVYAGPAVRRLARELGVDLAQVAGTGARGRIVRDDVKALVKRALAAPPMAHAGLAPMPEVDFSRFGEVAVEPLSRLRARGAANLHRAWQHVVHVTAHDDADVTDLEAFRRTLRDEATLRGVKVSPLPFIVKACVLALGKHPRLNASLNAAATSIIYKRYHHIGIAVDTAEGLVVPVVRDAGAKGIFALAEEIARLSAAVRERRLKPEELQGASFTVSSLGAIGGTGFTPIVNAPEVAILGVARVDTRPVWDGSSFVPHQMLPLSLSYDHRAINGAEAGRFLADLRTLLGDVRRFAL